MGASSARAGELAVLPSTGAGVDDADLARVDAALRGRLAARGLALVEATAVAKEAAAARELGLRCEGDDAECLLELGTVAGFERVLAATVTRAGEGAVLQLTLLDTDPPSVEATAQASISLGKDLDLRGPVVALFEPEAYTGGLHIVGAPAGARILVDGELKGTAPMDAPISGLAVGVHHVRVEHESAPPLQTQAVVPFADTATVEVVLAPPVGPRREAELAGGPPSEAEGPSALSYGVVISGGVAAAFGAVLATAGGLGLGGAALSLASEGGIDQDRAQMQVAGGLGVAALVVGGAVVVGGGGLAALGLLL